MRHSLTRELPYQPGDLFDLVADVEAYPLFVRWISSMRTWNRRSDVDGVTTLDAEAQVKFSVVNERFATHVRMDRPNLAIDVALLSGPFKRLENHWKFVPNGQTSEVHFDIDCEFRSQVLQGLLGANVGKAARLLVRRFENRAAELYGAK